MRGNSKERERGARKNGFASPQDIKALVMGGVAICNKFSVLFDSLLQRLAGGDGHARTCTLARHGMGICCREVIFALEERRRQPREFMRVATIDWFWLCRFPAQQGRKSKLAPPLTGREWLRIFIDMLQAAERASGDPELIVHTARTF